MTHSNANYYCNKVMDTQDLITDVPLLNNLEREYLNMPQPQENPFSDFNTLFQKFNMKVNNVKKDNNDVLIDMDLTEKLVEGKKKVDKTEGGR